jgi:hypothetical protein
VTQALEVGGFPEEVGLVGGHLIYQVRRLFFSAFGAEKILAVLGKGGEIQLLQSLLDTGFQHRPLGVGDIDAAFRIDELPQTKEFLV